MPYRNQPVFLIDKGNYRVLLWDPFQKTNVYLDFGDSESPEITVGILEKDPKFIELRDIYLDTNNDNDDPLTPEYWVRRYVWRSGESYNVYHAPDDKNLVEPSFPAQNAIDPPNQTVIVPGYAYGGPYYTQANYPYTTTYTTYYPYYSNRHSTAAVVGAGLAGLAVGALLL